MEAFQRICEEKPASLVEAALDLAADEYPNLRLDRYLQQIQTMGADFVRTLGPISPRGADCLPILTALNRFFFEDLGFAGVTGEYYDPQNSYINCVLDRRVGIPISLSILYQEIADHAGLRLSGVNMPGHFLLAYQPSHGPRVYIDVFNGGLILPWPECLARLFGFFSEGTSPHERDFPPMPPAAILVRMLRNLKGIYSRGDLPRCLRTQERIVQLAPFDPAEQRDLGILYCETGQPLRAVATFEQLVARLPHMASDRRVHESFLRAKREACLLN